MTVIVCPDCGDELGARARRCPSCAHYADSKAHQPPPALPHLREALETPGPRRRINALWHRVPTGRAGLWVFGAVAAVVILALSARRLEGLLGWTDRGAEARSTDGAPVVDAAPTFGTLALSAGFTPDPAEAQLVAGGSEEVVLPYVACEGYIKGGAPDLDLHYEARGYPLSISAHGEAPLSLVVNLPDGRWLCDGGDDGSSSVVHIPEPESGLYHVWVGAYSTVGSPAATLAVSEKGW
jgi:hypothetical protein